MDTILLKSPIAFGTSTPIPHGLYPFLLTFFGIKLNFIFNTPSLSLD